MRPMCLEGRSALFSLRPCNYVTSDKLLIKITVAEESGPQLLQHHCQYTGAQYVDMAMHEYEIVVEN